MNKPFNMNKITCILCISLFLSVSAVSTSQNVVIYGNAPSYANREIVFNSYCDQVSSEEQEIGRCMADSSGNFKVSFNTDNITFIFSHLGVYKAFLYVKPDKEYEIILPERADRTPEELLNPYFTESRIQLGIANIGTDDLNFLIRIFNDAYTPFYNKHILNFIGNDDFSELDADIERMEKPFVNSTNTFFNDYRKYRYGLIKFLSSQKKAVTTQEDYFKNKPVLFNNPAYMELFNQVYNKYFMLSARTGEGKEIYNAINNSENYLKLKNALAANKVFSNDTILELVILKEIYSEFYDDNFSRKGLLNILDTLMSQTKIQQNKLIGNTVKTKITKLLSGYDPPAFELYDAENNLITLSKFKGRYVYLNFCMSYSYTCLGEFEILDGIYERHKDRLEIITIIVEPDPAVFIDFLTKNNYNWTFLYYGNQPQVLKEYDIRAYPTYFLIGPDGELLISPSPSPSENFESKLISTMKGRGDL